MGVYIYSIINEKQNRNFGNIGLRNHEVIAVTCKDIAATASFIEGIDLGSVRKEELPAYITSHQRVNEALLREYDVVPMSFGTVAQNEGEIVKIMEKCYLQLKTTLQKISGRIEFVLQVFVDQERLLREIIQAHPEIQELKNKALPIGLASLSSKIKVGKLLFEKAESERKAYREYIIAFLKSTSHDSAPHALIDPQMILNESFLIEKTQELEFDRKMAQLGEQYDGKLRFKYIGPMPPYSFTHINFSRGNFELINEARSILGLGKQVSRSEIQKAYYASAQKYHPDKHGGSNETAEAMKKINDAHAILETCCQSFDMLAGKSENRIYSFREKDIKNLIMIT